MVEIATKATLLVVLREIENDEGEKITMPFPFTRSPAEEARVVDMLKKSGAMVSGPPSAKARAVWAKRTGKKPDEIPENMLFQHVFPDKIDAAVRKLVTACEIEIVENLAGLAFDTGTEAELKEGHTPFNMSVDEIRTLVYLGYFAKSGFEWLKPPSREVIDQETREPRQSTLAEEGLSRWPDENVLISRGVDAQLVDAICNPQSPSRETMAKIQHAFAASVQAAAADAEGAERGVASVDSMRAFEGAVVGGLNWLAAVFASIPPWEPKVEGKPPPDPPFAGTAICLMNLARAFQAESAQAPWSAAQARKPESF